MDCAVARSDVLCVALGDLSHVALCSGDCVYIVKSYWLRLLDPCGGKV